MKKAILALAALAVLAFVALSVLERSSNDRSAISPSAEDSKTTRESANLTEFDEPLATDAEPRVAANLQGAKLAEAVVEDTSETTAERPVLRGRFLLPGGEPAIGVQFRVHGWTGNQDRAMKFGVPDDWEDPSGESGAEGTFALAFDPPRAYQFTLDAKLEGYAEVSWRWRSLPADKTTDVGDVTLERAGSIIGYVVDAKGERFKTGWRVYADASEKVGEGRDATRGISSLDSVTGQYRIDGMPAGPTQLKANSRIANWIDGPVVDVRAGEIMEANIRYGGPDLSRRISVVTFSRPFFVFSGEPNRIQLSRSGEVIGALERLEGSSQTHTFEDLDPNSSYDIEIIDERFLPWSKVGVRPGESVNASLVGNASALLSVLDDETGEPVASFDLRVRFPDASFRPNEFQVIEAKDEALEGGRLDSLIPQTQELIVLCEGYSKSVTLLEDLAPNESRSVTIRLIRGSKVAGEALQSNGSAAAGAQIRIAPGEISEEQWHEVHSMWGSDLSDSVRLVAASDDGSFKFESVPPGTWSLDAAWSGLSVRTTFDASSGTLTRVDVNFPGTGALEGLLVGPAGAKLEGLEIFVVSKKNAESLSNPTHQDALGEQREVSDATGAFRVSPLPTGPARVLLALPQQSIPTSFRSGGSLRAPWISLGEVDITEGEPTRGRFDVSEILPGSLRVTVNINGSPAAGAVAIANCENDRTRGRRGGTIEADGSTLLPRLFPGEYQIEVYTLERNWTYTSEETVTIEPSAATSFHAEITTAQGTLSVVDSATGSPAGGAEIGWRFASSPHPNAAWRRPLGADGELKLEILPGIYEFGIIEEFGRFEAGTVTVEWTLAGPTEPTIRLGSK